MAIKLYDNAFSPYAFKVRGVLYEKGIDFEHFEVIRESDREELTKVSPRGEVPALVDEDTVVFDSRVISEYLEDRYPDPPLGGIQPASRAVCRAIEALSDTQLDACVFVIALVKFFRPHLAETHPEVERDAGGRLRVLQRKLDEMLVGRDFFAGELTRADIALVPHLGAAEFIGYPIEDGHDRLKAWWERMNERESVKRAMADFLIAMKANQQVEDPFFSNDRLHWRNDRIEWALRCGLADWLVADLREAGSFLPDLP